MQRGALHVAAGTEGEKEVYNEFKSGAEGGTACGSRN